MVLEKPNSFSFYFKMVLFLIAFLIKYLWSLSGVLGTASGAGAKASYINYRALCKMRIWKPLLKMQGKSAAQGTKI